MVVFLFHSDRFEITALFAIANGQHGYLPDTGILVSALLFTASLHAKIPLFMLQKVCLRTSPMTLPLMLSLRYMLGTIPYFVVVRRRLISLFLRRALCMAFLL